MPKELAVQGGGALVRTLTPEQLALLKRNLGGGKLSNDEFDLFIETAKHLGLDPFKKQIVPIVFNANDPMKRRVENIVTQQGYRSKAVETGTWGPWVDEDAIRQGKEPAPNPQIFYKEELVDPDTNPLGIDYAVYYCKRYRADGHYDIVMGKARWVERVPIREEWVKDEKTGRRQPTGKFFINSPEWRISGQPAHMIGKCAECDALRRGWPDAFSGFYSAEDMARAKANEDQYQSMQASAQADQHEAERRMRAVGGDKSILFCWEPGDPLTNEKPGELPDKILAWLRKQEHPLAVQKFEERNAAPMNQLWAISKSDALAIKEAIEQRVKELSVIDVEQEEEAGTSPASDEGRLV